MWFKHMAIAYIAYCGWCSKGKVSRDVDMGRPNISFVGCFSALCTLRRNRMIRISVDDAEEIIAFVKMHEREEIPNEMWEIVMALQDKLEEFY